MVATHALRSLNLRMLPMSMRDLDILRQRAVDTPSKLPEDTNSWISRTTGALTSGVGAPFTYAGELDDYYRDEVRGAAHVTYLPPNSHLPHGLAHSSRAGGGRGTRAESELKALMEGIERVCLSTWDTETTRVASTEELALEGLSYLGPHEYPHHLAGTWNLARPIHWELAESTTECLWIPSGLIRCPWDEILPAPFLDPSSSGAAASFSLQDAVFRGAYELLERHFIISSHHHQARAIRLDFDSLELGPYATRAWLEAEAMHLTVRAYQITADPICVASCYVVDGSSHFPSVTFGSGAADNLVDAVSSALLEAVFARRQVRDHLFAEAAVASAEIQSIAERLTYWGTRTVQREFDYLESGAPLPQQVVRIAEDAKYSWVDLTTPSAARVGAHVAKVVSPQLQPIYYDETKRFSMLGVDISSLEPHPYG
jgi:ribosomal protein S12 methylthiotransferase accessory factor YcaO